MLLAKRSNPFRERLRTALDTTVCKLLENVAFEYNVRPYGEARAKRRKGWNTTLDPTTLLPLSVEGGAELLALLAPGGAGGKAWQISLVPRLSSNAFRPLVACVHSNP